jgi:hypothetical protein
MENGMLETTLLVGYPLGMFAGETDLDLDFCIFLFQEASY